MGENYEAKTTHFRAVRGFATQRSLQKYSIAKNLLMHPLNSIRNKALHKRSDFFIDALHILVLFAFALAQPLFDLLSKHAEFFVARKSEPIDIILFVLIVCLGIPAIAVLTEGVAGLFGRHVRKTIHWFMVSTLLAVIGLQVLKKIFESPGIALIVIAAILGVAATVAYVRFQRVRTYLTALSPAILIFPILFLFNSPVYKVVFPDKDPSALKVQIDNPPPIVMVVFDEFPVTSLLDKNGQIDPIRYPNFAALAEDSYWFRNAMTVAAQSMMAIPALLTGKHPDPSLQAVAADYPNNLFTLLGDCYNIKDFEIYTQLCSDELRSEDLTSVNLSGRIALMIWDLSVVYLHIILPTDVTNMLPSISEGWMGFIGDMNDPKGGSEKKSSKNVPLSKPSPKLLYSDRPGQFLRFVHSIESHKKPTFHFLHLLLPHGPWEYYPSGKRYNLDKRRGLVVGSQRGKMWVDDEWVVMQAYQKHLLQVGLVDVLLGTLMKRLKKQKIYNKCLLVVTADHGFAFKSNDYSRVATESNIGDIASIPLFVKTPLQKKGLIVDKPIKTIDLLPTIADILDIQIPWACDGRSALNNHAVQRTKLLFMNPSKKRSEFEIEHVLRIKQQTLKKKAEVFGSGKEPQRIYEIGPFKHLNSKSFKSLDIVAGNSRIELSQAPFYRNINLKSSFVPGRIAGLIFPKGGTETQLVLAISVNGVIRGTTSTFQFEKDCAEWSVMVPEKVFRNGKNEIEVFAISRVGTRIILEGTKRAEETAHFLCRSEGIPFETIISSEGQSIPVMRGELVGHLATPELGDVYVSLSGWAADLGASRPADAIMVFVDGNAIHSGRCNEERPDVARKYHNPALINSGFKYFLPLSLFGDGPKSEVRIFAISRRGMAAEVYYPKGYKWRKKVLFATDTPRKGTGLYLIPSRIGSNVTYALCISDKAGSIKGAIKVVSKALQGYLDTTKVENDNLMFSGWAADVKNSQVADSIVIFVNDKFFYSGQCNFDRPDVARQYADPVLGKAGFKYSFPLSSFGDLSNSQVRFFAISKKGVASELIYPERHKLGTKIVIVSPVSDEDRKLDLTQTTRRPKTTYSLSASNEHREMLICSNGRSIPIIPGTLRVHLGHAQVRGDSIILEGWAADVKKSRIAEAIIIFINGEFFFSGQCNASRPDVVKAFNNPKLLGSGFKFRFPFSLFENPTNSEVRLFAMSKKGTASELIYPKGYRWRKKDVQIPGEAVSKVKNK